MQIAKSKKGSFFIISECSSTYFNKNKIIDNSNALKINIVLKPNIVTKEMYRNFPVFVYFLLFDCRFILRSQHHYQPEAYDKKGSRQ